MAIILTQKEIDNIKNYKYSTSPWTPLDKVFDPWWNFCCNRLPVWVAPNLLTLMGIIFPVIALIQLVQFDFTNGEVVPSSVLLMNAFAVFWYQTIDAIDGKQARKTDNCSCLGQILDHNLDQFSHVFFCIINCSMVRSGSGIISTLMIVNGQLLPHYSIEFRKHFTGFHATVVETAGGVQIGATECCCIMMGLNIMFALLPNTNRCAEDIIDIQKLTGIPFPSFSFGGFISFNTFFLSIQYNIGNFYYGIQASKDKVHALLCMLPFFQVIGMLWLSSMYSQFWEEYVIFFMFGIGILITNMTGNLNLKSSAQVKFNPIYIDPFIFVIILYFDYNRLVDSQYVVFAYTALVVERCIMYILFMKGTVDQLCRHLCIPFIRVKQLQVDSSKKSK